MLYRLGHYSLKFLAEKITRPTRGFDHARKLGFHYFQGYFFARPESLQIVEIASNKISLLNLLAEINRPQTTVDRLSRSLPPMSPFPVVAALHQLRLLRQKQVDSIRQAIIYLGEREIRRFVTLVIVSELAADKPAELVRLSVIRARWCGS